jgi:hypothetical protein
MPVQDQYQAGRVLRLILQPFEESRFPAIFQRSACFDQRVPELKILECGTGTLGIPETAERGRSKGDADDQPEGEKYSQQQASHRNTAYSAGTSR